MKQRLAMLAAIGGLLSGAALAQGSSAEPASGAVSEPDAAVKALVDSCSARKFETVVPVAPGRGSRVKICGKPGQTDAEWIVTLKDSMAKAEANTAMAPAVREKIVAALEAEIARLEGGAATAVTPPVSAPPVSAQAEIKLDTAPVAAFERAPQYSSLPPLPAPKRPARPNLGAGSAAVAAEPAIVRPKLTLLCGLPGEEYATCLRLRGSTRLMVRAGEDIAAGTLLRYVRDGEMREEIDLGTLKKGAAVRHKLPSRVCAGVFRAKVQVEVVTKGRVAESFGPFALDCRPDPVSI